MTHDSRLETLRKHLRAKLKTGGEIQIAADDLRVLIDEIGRLQQSSDRLRRQNRRLRVKLQRAGLADDEAAGGGEHEEQDERDAGDAGGEAPRDGATP